ISFPFLFKPVAEDFDLVAERIDVYIASAHRSISFHQILRMRRNLRSIVRSRPIHLAVTVGVGHFFSSTLFSHAATSAHSFVHFSCSSIGSLAAAAGSRMPARSGSG